MGKVRVIPPGENKERWLKRKNSIFSILDFFRKNEFLKLGDFREVLDVDCYISGISGKVIALYAALNDTKSHILSIDRDLDKGVIKIHDNKAVLPEDLAAIKNARRVGIEFRKADFKPRRKYSLITIFSFCGRRQDALKDDWHGVIKQHLEDDGIAIITSYGPEIAPWFHSFKDEESSLMGTLFETKVILPEIHFWDKLTLLLAKRPERFEKLLKDDVLPQDSIFLTNNLKSLK